MIGRLLALAAAAALLGAAAPPAPKGAPAQPALAAQRAARVERGLAAQRELARAIRSGPEKFELWTDKPGAHLLFDAVADCVTTDRIGRVGDGGKWICNAAKLSASKPCVVYGVGAGREVSFEQAMASEYGCEVHVFDPTPSAVARFAPLAKGQRFGAGSVTFHPWGLGPVSRDPANAMKLELEGKACEVKTLADIAKALGHARVDVLKIDIEGGEWAALDDAFSRKLLDQLQIQQLLLEVHLWAPAKPIDLVNLIEGLAERGFLLYRKELNPWSPGCCSEYAFAQRRFLLD